MIPDAETLARVARLPGGQLADTPFALLLCAHAAHQVSAVLDVNNGPVAKQITLAAGTPVDCQSNLLQDTLGRFLVGRRQLTEEQYGACKLESDRTDRSLEEVLIAAGLLDPETHTKAAQQLLARKLLDVFAWRRGEFMVTHLASPPPATASAANVKMKPAQLIVMGIVKFASEEEIAAAIDPLAERRLYLDPEPTFALAEIKLTVAQQRVAQGVGIGKTVAELTADPDEAAAVRRTLYALALIGVVVATEPTRRIVAPSLPAAPPLVAPPLVAPPLVAPPLVAPPLVAPPLAAPPLAAPPLVAPPLGATTRPLPTPALPDDATRPLAAPTPLAATPMAPTDRSIADAARATIRDLHARYRGLDAFDLLGLKPTTDLLAIERAYLELARRVAPWPLNDDDPDALASKGRELFLAAARALGELSDLERRTSLSARRTSRLEQETQKLAAARDAFRIKTQLLDPDEQFRRGLKYIEARKFAEGIEQLQHAADCDPQNSVYRAELARAQYLSSPPTRARQAVIDLEEAVRVDPECGIALFYLGEILAATGREEHAQEPLKRAARLMLPDRRPLDLLNSLTRDKKKGGVWGIGRR